MANLHQQAQQEVSTQQQQMWLILWHLGVLYKCQLFMWKIPKDISHVAARFMSLAKVHNPLCHMCAQSIETSSHLLLQCPYAQAIWSGVSSFILQVANSFGDIQKWIQSWVERNQLVSITRKELLNLAVVTMWHIWKNRCLKVFEDKMQAPGSIIRQIYNFCHTYHICIHITPSSSIHTSTLSSTKNHRCWTPPLLHWLKINFDASIIPGTNFYVLAFVVRNHLGEFMGAMAWTRRAREVDQAEVLALKKVAQWIKDKNLSKVMVEGDNKTIMEAMQYQKIENTRWED
ncbi:uncharacterized protein LOC113306142 [Papaver somniferum]|uniref:uncharacterized protein LOC113306142 n=1 Tax=Papaver somniferum TaxID=3469 RepID=UPI000E6FB943|nr:uncharacterized protein LOC113306142 [Papaver somniferum]